MGGNPFASFFMGGFSRQKEDFRSLEEIMKEFDEFFHMENQDEKNLGDYLKNKGYVKGKDIEVDIDIGFEEAYSGTSRYVEYASNVLCNPCKSTGKKSGEREISC